VERDERAAVIDQLYGASTNEPTVDNPECKDTSEEVATAVEAMTIDEDGAIDLTADEVNAAAKKEQVKVTAAIEAYIGLTNEKTTLKPGKCGEIFERAATFVKLRLEDNSEYVVLANDFTKLEPLVDTSNVEGAEQPEDEPMVAFQYQEGFEKIMDFGFEVEPNVVRYLLTENKGDVGAVVNNLLAAS